MICPGLQASGLSRARTQLSGRSLSSAERTAGVRSRTGIASSSLKSIFLSLMLTGESYADERPPTTFPRAEYFAQPACNGELSNFRSSDDCKVPRRDRRSRGPLTRLHNVKCADSHCHAVEYRDP